MDITTNTFTCPKQIALRILAIINGWRDKTIRGGDYHTLMVSYHWSKDNRIFFIMPKLGYESAEDMMNYKQFVYFSSNKEMQTDCLFRLILLYSARIIRSLFFKPQGEVNIVISSSHGIYDIIPALILSRRLDSKLVVYVHHLVGSFRKYKEGTRSIVSLIGERLSILLCRKADLIFVMNSETRDTLKREGLSADKICVTGNAVDRNLIDSVQAQKKIFDACFCGRLTKRKGVHDLLEVWQRVLKCLPLSRLVIIGQGPEYSKLLKTVRNYRMDKAVVLTGYIPQREKIRMMKSSKIFVFPSYEEGWGIAIREAIACGLHVVCYDLSPYRVLGNRITTVEVGDKESMAKMIIHQMVSNKAQIGSCNNAEEADLLFDWSKIAKQELKQIKNVQLRYMHEMQ